MKSAPLLIGLTGSIGMGKSTTARIFEAEGIPVWDADAAVHRLYAKGGGAVPAISRLCPDATESGSVDRATLADWIARDPSHLSQVEAAVHPLVAKDRADFIANATAPILLLDIPLLYETGADKEMDVVVVVSTDPETQRKRVLDRPGMTRDRLDGILARQVPDEEKRARADYVVRTDTLEAATTSVHSILRDIKGRLNARNRAGHRDDRV